MPSILYGYLAKKWEGVLSFVDYYDVLEISPNAGPDTIERIFRHLARRYHPDNPATADRDRFDLILEAHDTLRDAVKRAQYDIEHRRHASLHVELAEEAGDSQGIERDSDVQARLLSLFYVKCRKDVRDPGIGDAELEQLLDCPREHLEFHLWYLKEKKWIARRENGALAITVDGVDRASSENHIKAANKQLTDQS